MSYKTQGKEWFNTAGAPGNNTQCSGRCNCGGRGISIATTIPVFKETLIEICKKLGSSDYLIQKSAEKYLDKDLFSDANIALHFFTPPTPIYPQLWGEFIPNLSLFDLFFNCGPKSHEILFLKQMVT